MEKDDEKEPRENDKCMDKRSNGDTAGKKGQSGGGASMKDRVKALKSNKYALVIVILCVLVVILFIVIIALAVRLGSRTPTVVPYCDSSDCLKASAKLKAGIDDSFDPCDDFWSYSCGNWLKKNPVPSSRGSYSVSDKTTVELYKKLRHLIDLTPLDDSKYFKPEVKLKKFYSSCVALKYIESSLATPLTNIINNLNGWDVFGTFSTEIFNKETVLKELHTKYGLSPFFKVDVVASPKEAQKAIIEISQSGLGLDDKSMYDRNQDDPHVVAYKSFIKDLLRSFDRSNSQLSPFVDNIFHYEKRLAEITKTPKEIFEMTGKIMKISELLELSPRVPWLDLLETYFPNAKITIATEVLVQNPKYLQDISGIISSTDEKTLNNYLIWRLVSHYSKFLSKEFRNVHDRFNEMFTGSIIIEDRWYECLDITNQLFGYAMGSLYTREYFDDPLNEDLSKIAKSVIDTLASNVRYSRWMDGRTKESAMRKVKEIVKYVGYPPFILNEHSLKEYYNEFQVQTSYFNNIVNGVHFHRTVKENYLIDGFDASRNYPAFPQSHNPTYQVVMNNLVIPFGVIELPTYHQNYPLSIKYGSFGSIVAQKIVRSIDKIGSVYDEFGLEKAWWTNTTKKKYNALQNCLMNFYDGFKVENVEVNGNLTVHNNVDDVVGLKQAYNAYVDAAASSDEKPLAGIGRTPKQQFFISYAQTMCQNIREQQLQSIENSCLYPANKARVMASLSLLPEFREAFECTHRSPQCRVW